MQGKRGWLDWPGEWFTDDYRTGARQSDAMKACAQFSYLLRHQAVNPRG